VLFVIPDAAYQGDPPVAYEITGERVEALRRVVSTDEQIFDLAAIASRFNASARLAVLLSPPPAATRSQRETFVAADR
jgi:hypothetical protein